MRLNWSHMTQINSNTAAIRIPSVAILAQQSGLRAVAAIAVMFVQVSDVPYENGQLA